MKKNTKIVYIAVRFECPGVLSHFLHFQFWRRPPIQRSRKAATTGRWIPGFSLCWRVHLYKSINCWNFRFLWPNTVRRATFWTWWPVPARRRSSSASWEWEPRSWEISAAVRTSKSPSSPRRANALDLQARWSTGSNIKVIAFNLMTQQRRIRLFLDVDLKLIFGFCRQPYPAKPHGFTIGAVLAPDLSASLDTTVQYILILKYPHVLPRSEILSRVLLSRLVPFNQPSTVAFPSSSPVLR